MTKEKDQAVQQRFDITDWVSIKDRLPPARKYVVLLRKGGVVGFGYKEISIPEIRLWTDVTRRDRDGDWLAVSDVTHWYPIPEVERS